MDFFLSALEVGSDRVTERDKRGGGCTIPRPGANTCDSVLLHLQTELDFKPVLSAPTEGKLTICLFV